MFATLAREVPLPSSPQLRTCPAKASGSSETEVRYRLYLCKIIIGILSGRLMLIGHQAGKDPCERSLEILARQDMAKQTGSHLFGRFAARRLVVRAIRVGTLGRNLGTVDQDC